MSCPGMSPLYFTKTAGQIKSSKFNLKDLGTVFDSETRGASLNWVIVMAKIKTVS